MVALGHRNAAASRLCTVSHRKISHIRNSRNTLGVIAHMPTGKKRRVTFALVLAYFPLAVAYLAFSGQLGAADWRKASREPAGLAREITRWLRDDAPRRSAAAAARPWAMSQFDWNDIAGRWVEHYSRVAAAGAGRVPDRGTISQ